VAVKLRQRQEPEGLAAVALVQMELVGQVKQAVQIQAVAVAAVKARFWGLLLA
jgi:hypothetical protein